LLTRNLAAVPERRARFTEERRFAALDQPLHSQGILLWRRPDVLEKHTEAPQPETLRVEGDRVEVFLPGRTQRSISLASQPQLRALVEGMRAPLSGDVLALERHFEVTLTGGPASWRMHLVPRDRRMRETVTAMQIEGTLASPREIRVTHANGDVQILRVEPLP